MKKITITFCLLSYFMFQNVQTFSQPTITWQRTLGGTSIDEVGDPNNFFDSPNHCLALTNDGGLIMVGNTASSNGDVTFNHGSRDYWVVKFNSSYNIQWQKSFGGSNDDRATSVIQTSDGGYAVAGFSNSSNGDLNSNNGNYDYWIVKLDAAGNISWQKNFGGTGIERAFSIIEVSGGSFVVAGVTSSNNTGDVSGSYGGDDFWVIKISSSGALIWQKPLGGNAQEWANSVIETSDKGLIVAGFTSSTSGLITNNHGMSDCWVVKLDSAGNFVWEKTYGGTSNDYGTCIINTSDGGFVLTAFTYSSNGDVISNHGSSDFWVVKLSNTGNIQWQKTFGGTNSDEAYEIVQTSDGGYAISGAVSSNDGDVTGYHGNWDYWIVKTNSLGTMEWQKCMGGSTIDWSVSLLETTDHSLLAAGSVASSNGDIAGNHGLTDIWIVKLDAAISVNEINGLHSSVFEIYPNPFINSFNIVSRDNEQILKIVIRDITGQIIYVSEESTAKIELNNKLASGIYLTDVHYKTGVVHLRSVKVNSF